MAGGNPSTGREERDFYPTPMEVPWALLKAEQITGSIHECACGNGAMTRIFEKVGFKVVSTDIHPLGVGEKISFFDVTEPLADNIITNPPFDLAEEFIRHALEVLKPQMLALVLKSTYWHAASRKKLFDQHRPAAIYPLLWRPDFMDLGRPTMEVMWCVWRRDHVGPTIYLPLPNPRPRISRKRVARSAIK